MTRAHDRATVVSCLVTDKCTVGNCELRACTLIVEKRAASNSSLIVRKRTVINRDYRAIDCPGVIVSSSIVIKGAVVESYGTTVAKVRAPNRAASVRSSIIGEDNVVES